MSVGAPEPLLELSGLTVDYERRGRGPAHRAVDGVDLHVAVGETLGLVGESGAGKSTIGRAVLGLTAPSGGVIRFLGNDITHADAARRRALSAHMQVVFQDPYGSLNPTRTIGQTLAEPLRVHRRLAVDELTRATHEMLARVGFEPDAAERYPAQFSGGQRQRIAIARALMVSPEFVVCDEPVSALDLSVQAQVLNLLADLQRELSVSYLFVAHDVAVVRHVSHRIAVLYSGRVAEIGPAEAVYATPVHPYTRALRLAEPLPDPGLQRSRRALRRERIVRHAPVASAEACAYASRCPHAIEICRTVRPRLEPTPTGAAVACHRWPELESRHPVGVESWLEAPGASQLP